MFDAESVAADLRKNLARALAKKLKDTTGAELVVEDGPLIASKAYQSEAPPK